MSSSNCQRNVNLENERQESVSVEGPRSRVQGRGSRVQGLKSEK